MDLEKARKVETELKHRANGIELVVAGSVRRGKPTGIKDLDVIVVGEKIPKLLDDQKGGEKTQRGTLMGERVDFSLCSDREQLGAMLLFFTGSKWFNIRLRTVAKEKGWKLNRYALTDAMGGVIASRTEADIMVALGMQVVPPEGRS